MIFNTAILLVWVLGFGNPVFADNASDACIRNLRSIDRALDRHQHERSAMPSELRDLFPKFLRDRSVFQCPADKSSAEPGDSSLRVSYVYEMSGRPDSSGSRYLGPGPKGKNHTWLDVKFHQRIWFGDRVPAVRCRNHEKVLNLTLDGKIYESEGVWETHPSTLSEVLSSILRDLRGGRETFNQLWHVDKVADYFRSLRNQQSVDPALRVKLRSAGSKALTTLVTGREETDGPGHFLAGALFYSAGDLDRAMPAFEKAALLEPDSTARTAVNKLGEIYVETARSDRPIRFYRRLIERYPEEPAFYRKLAEAYESAGQAGIAAQWRAKAEEVEAARRPVPEAGGGKRNG